MEKIEHFCQADLCTSSVMILDANSVVWVWIGAKVTNLLKKNAMKVIEEYKST